tara:strand:+ start:290 stop:550 length:261 start_codon:yes stop_codon:yes gene_type:complete
LITYLDATENGSVILQDTTFTNGGKVLYEGKSVEMIVMHLLNHGFDTNNYFAGSTLAENEEAQKLFRVAFKDARDFQENIQNALDN